MHPLATDPPLDVAEEGGVLFRETLVLQPNTLFWQHKASEETRREALVLSNKSNVDAATACQELECECSGYR